MAPGALAEIALAAKKAIKNGRELSVESMALGASVLNKLFRQEMEKQGFGDTYCGLIGTVSLSIDTHPIPVNASRVVLFARDPGTEIWIAIYAVKRQQDIVVAIYDGVGDDVPALLSQGSQGPGHADRMNGWLRRLPDLLKTYNWFDRPLSTTDSSILTTVHSPSSGEFSLAWGEWMVRGWEIKLSSSEEATGGLPLAWGAIADYSDHDAVGGEQGTCVCRWSAVLHYRFRWIGKHKAYDYDN